MAHREDSCTEDDVGRFREVLAEATRGFPEEYFSLPVAGRQSGIYRERVYCYELYHRLRCRWPSGFTTYRLMGEIDKTDHPRISGSSVPDFLVHEPGDMHRNLVIMEVKHVEGLRSDRVRNDLEKLQNFLARDIGYAAALYLFFGESETEEIAGAVRRAAERCPSFGLSRVEAYHHRHPERAASRVPL